MNKLFEIIEQIGMSDEEAITKTELHLDQLTKPPGSLGEIEALAIRLASIIGFPLPEKWKKAIVIMAADHGVCEEGVSQYPQAVTGQMILNFLHGGAAINVFARQTGADVICVDVGSLAKLDDSRLYQRKVREGTGNIALEPAMTIDEAQTSVQVGIEIALQLISDGYTCIATGEMGIGNTTVSSALLAARLQQPVSALVGSGTGIDDTKKMHKVHVVERAVQRYQQIKKHDPRQQVQFGLELLSQLGGLEIAGLVGLILGASSKRIPVVIDGFISTAAAVIACTIAPNSRNFLIASHVSQEPGHRLALQWLQMEAMFDFKMRLGEGTGAALVFPFIDVATHMMHEMATFTSAGVSKESS